MALTTFDEMKQEILDNWEQFQSNQYPEDLLSEFADSACPVYNGDIIKEWQEMPSEFDDSWRDYGDSVEGATIVKLMQMDLFNYYHHLARNAYNELADEMEPSE